MQDEHVFLLTDLLPQYRSINVLYREIAEKSILSFEAQCSITDFYNDINNIQVFEKAVLNFLLSTDKEKQTLIISNLRTEITKNIEVYVSNKDFFKEIDIIKVCSGRYNPLKIEIEGQLKDTNELWQELTKVRNSLESASWKNDKIAIERLTREEEKVEGLYKKEQEKLESLYRKQKESDNHASKYLKNVFGKIYELGCSFISLLNNYFPVEIENISEPSIAETETLAEPELQVIIEPDMIFRTKMYERFLLLEQRLVKDKYLDENLHWISTHKNGRLDIKRLVVFLVGLHTNNYFLPNRDPKIKQYFETRYHIKIGQNFEKKRREPLTADYKIVFHDYLF